MGISKYISRVLSYLGKPSRAARLLKYVPDADLESEPRVRGRLTSKDNEIELVGREANIARNVFVKQITYLEDMLRGSEGGQGELRAELGKLREEYAVLEDERDRYQERNVAGVAKISELEERVESAMGRAEALAVKVEAQEGNERKIVEQDRSMLSLQGHLGKTQKKLGEKSEQLVNLGQLLKQEATRYRFLEMEIENSVKKGLKDGQEQSKQRTREMNKELGNAYTLLRDIYRKNAKLAEKERDGALAELEEMKTQIEATRKGVKHKDLKILKLTEALADVDIHQPDGLVASFRAWEEQGVLDNVCGLLLGDGLSPIYATSLFYETFKTSERDLGAYVSGFFDELGEDSRAAIREHIVKKMKKPLSFKYEEKIEVGEGEDPKKEEHNLELQPSYWLNGQGETMSTFLQFRPEKSMWGKMFGIFGRGGGVHKNMLKAWSQKREGDQSDEES